MKKFLFLFFLGVFVNIISVYSQSIFKQDLNKRFTVDFPDTPTVRTLTKDFPFTVFTVKKGDDSYVAVIIKIDTAETVVHSDNDVTVLYDGIIKGATEESPKIVLSFKNSIEIGKIKGIAYKIINSKNPNKTFYSYQHAFYQDNNIFAFIFTTSDDSLLNQKKGYDFLNSVTIR